MKADVDVVIVGAGPVGLLAAIELKLGGAEVVVLERLATPSRALKAGGIGPLGIEALRRRGMANAIAAAEAQAALTMSAIGGGGRPASGPRYSGHFGGLVLIRAEAQAEPDRLGSRIEQPVIEEMLSERARALGVEVRRGCEITALEPSPDELHVEWTSPGGPGHVRCGHLVGCDGGRSAVRKLAGFGFPGWDPTLTMYQATATLDHPERLPAGAGFHHTPGGMFMTIPGRLAVIDFSGPPTDRQAPVTHDELETALRKVTGADVRLTAFENASRWTDNARLADTYRRGRVFLAGDAAHIHSPFGGQGLSLGLADAANLGWKLAAVLRGDAPEDLLDSYEAERRPVAEAVLENTLAQVAIMRPDPQSTAMRRLVARFLDFDDLNGFLGGIMSGLSNRYDLGSDREEVGRLIGDRPVGDGRTLYGLMQDGSAVLLDASPDGAATQLASGVPRLRCATVEAGPSLFIRPDACVAWAAEAGDTEGLQAALDRWLPAER